MSENNPKKDLNNTKPHVNKYQITPILDAKTFKRSKKQLEEIAESGIENTSLSGKPYLRYMVSHIKKKTGIAKARYSAALGKACPTHFPAICRDGGIKLNVIDAFKIQKLTYGAIKVDRLLPEFSSMANEACYFNLDPSIPLTTETEEAIWALGFVRYKDPQKI